MKSRESGQSSAPAGSLEAAAPGENRSAPHAHTQIAHRSRDLAMPQCLRDRCQRHIFRLEKIRGEGSTDRMRRDRFARRDARRITRSVQRSGHCSGIRPFADEAVLRLSGRPERRLWSQQANKASEQNGICRSVPHSPRFHPFSEKLKNKSLLIRRFSGIGEKRLGNPSVSRFIIPFT